MVIKSNSAAAPTVEHRVPDYFPDPVVFMVSGLLGRLLFTVTTPVWLPILVGVNVTVNVQDAPAARELPHVFACV